MKGFAALSPERRKELASKAGKAAHAKGKAHKWNQETAREAGKKGGKSSALKGTGHRYTREEAVAAGLKSQILRREREASNAS